MKTWIICLVAIVAVGAGSVATWASYANAEVDVTQECAAEICPITGEPIVNATCPLEAAKSETLDCCKEES